MASAERDLPTVTEEGDLPKAPEEGDVPTAQDLPPNTSNAVRMYHALDSEMWALRRKGMSEENEKDCVEAERIAKMLLENADLPLVFRARACMVLALSSEPGYVEWAKEAVRTVNMGIEYADGGAGEEERKLSQACESVLRDAEADFEDLGGYGGGEEGEEGEEPGAGAETEDTGAMAEEQAGTTERIFTPFYTQPTATAGGGTATRRIDSARDVVQEWDEDTQQWIDIGPVE